MFHSSWRTTYSCLRDGGGGNLLLTLLCKTDHSGLTIYVWWLCWPGKMLKCIFMLLKPRLNTTGCVYGRSVTLKNCVIVRGKKLDHTMHHVVSGSNSTTQSNFGISIMPRYCCPGRHRSASMFHSWNQAFRIISFLGRSPNINPAWCWEKHLIILCVAMHWTSRFCDHNSTFLAF
jgi:hypothetical protein